MAHIIATQRAIDSAEIVGPFTLHGEKKARGFYSPSCDYHVPRPYDKFPAVCGYDYPCY